MSETNEAREDFVVEQAPDEIGRRRIQHVTIASIVVMAISLVVTWGLLDEWREGRQVEPSPPPVAQPTIGMLEQSLVEETHRASALRAEQEGALRQWGWVDRDAGLAKVPIDTAIDLFVEHPPPADQAIAPLAPTTTSAPPTREKDVRP